MSLFRRFHGREIFDHAWNGYRIDGRTITFTVDIDPNPLNSMLTACVLR